MNKPVKMVVNRHVFERRPRSTEGFRVPMARPARSKKGSR